MFEKWENIIISQINLAMYVPPKSAKTVHKNRFGHGLILNDSNTQVDYHFSDGTILKTYENSLYYLPKGSSYQVELLKDNGCFAINFDADFSDIPYSMTFRNPEKLIEIFKNSIKKYQEKPLFYQMSVKKSIFEIILLAIKEQQKNYVPRRKEGIIAPALNKIKTDFSSPDLSVSELSKMCGVSDTYFRKIFTDKLGITPKEYIIKLRIDSAKELLISGFYSISEVATLCGYAEPCHFSREFKKYMGVSPMEYLNT